MRSTDQVQLSFVICNIKYNIALILMLSFIWKFFPSKLALFFISDIIFSFDLICFQFHHNFFSFFLIIFFLFACSSFWLIYSLWTSTFTYNLKHTSSSSLWLVIVDVVIMIWLKFCLLFFSNLKSWLWFVHDEKWLTS